MNNITMDMPTRAWYIYCQFQEQTMFMEDFIVEKIIPYSHPDQGTYFRIIFPDSRDEMNCYIADPFGVPEALCDSTQDYLLKITTKIEYIQKTGTRHDVTEDVDFISLWEYVILHFLTEE